MDASIIQCNPNPFHFSSTPIPLNQPHSNLCLFKPFSPLPSITYRPRLSRRRKPFPLVFASANPSGSGDLSWLRLSQSIRRGSERFLSKLGDSVKKETGFDFEEVNVRVGEIVGRVREAAKKGEFEFDRLRSELVPEFIDWNEWDRWKDVKNWDRKRIGALVLYTFVVLFSCQRVYMVLRAPFIDRQRKELTEAYMEALVPEPTPANVRKFKKGMWRKTIPKGLKLKKFIEGPDGTDIQDSSYVGEDAWDDDPEPSPENVSGMIENDVKLNTEEKEVLREDLGVSGKNQKSTGTWRERLQKWNEVLRREKLAEQLDSLNAKYVVEFDMKEVENSLRKDVMEKVTNTQGTRGLWISKRWWRYRPKLPYIYFLQKLDSSEVAAVVFAEDLKQIYVTMKEGFPLEYVVDIPLDPYLFETISNSGVEVDLIQKKQIHYVLKVVIALLPGILILWFIRESLLLLLVTTKRLKYRKYKQFYDEARAKKLTRPSILTDQTKSMHDEVVLGGDVWDLLDELMMYLRNPMIYYEKRVAFVRGVLIAGPPGTGKTLFARMLANQSGVPFVQASGPEFAESEKGYRRLNRLFSLARRNAPCFVFIDEIDAIAGRHCRKDPRRGKTFDTLLKQLDGEKERIGVDRFSLSQAVIFLCATNRPQELHPEFIQPGRIDRRLYIGLPSEKQRVGIFYMHSAKMELAEDVDFQQVVFRTVGYSGADIRNIVNEAALMSMRKGHSKIYQQDIVDVLDKLLLEGMGVLLTEEEQQKSEQSVSFEMKRLLAVHEAGHVLLAHLFPWFDIHAFSQLLPGGKETAMSVFYPREEMREHPTFGYLMMQMVVAHGGRCAERIIFGDDITDRGRDDLKKITMMAREMVISPTNTRLGLTQLTRSYEVLKEKPQSLDSMLIRYRWDNPRVIPVDLTSEVAELFTRELTRYIEETEELAMKGLMDNRHILDMIARELLEKSRITGLDIGERIKGLSPTMFEDFAQPLQMDMDEDVPFPHNDRLTYQPLDVFPAPLHRC